MAASPETDYSALVALLAPEERDRFLVDLAEGEPGVAWALRKRLKAFLPSADRPAAHRPRTFARLMERGEALANAEKIRMEAAAQKKHLEEMKTLAGADRA